MLSFKIIGLLVLEKKFLKIFTIYGHGDHLGHVTKTIFTKFVFKKAPHLNLVLIGHSFFKNINFLLI